MFLKNSRSKLKSISVAIGVKLGFIPPEDAKTADDMIEHESDACPTLSLLVDKGFLDKAQAEVVHKARQKEAPLDEVNEDIKRVRLAIRNAWPTR